MTSELIAILATGVALLGSIGAVWFSMQREIASVRSEIGDVRSEVGDVRSEVSGVRSEMAGLNSRVGRIEGILSVVVASHTPLVENPARETG